MPKKKAPRTADAKRCTSLSPEGFFEPFNIDAVPWTTLRGATKFKRLGHFGGGSQVGVGIDLMKPGQYSNRFHYHLREEEHVFILKGQRNPGPRRSPVRHEGARLLLLPRRPASRPPSVQPHCGKLRVHDHRRQQAGRHRLLSKHGKGENPRNRKGRVDHRGLKG